MEPIFALAEYALSELKAAGAEAGRCQLDQGSTRELKTDAGELTMLRTAQHENALLTALIGGRQGTALTSDLSRESLRQAAALAVASASAAPDTHAELGPYLNCSFSSGELPGNLDALYLRTQELLHDVKQQYPLVALNIYSAAHRENHSLYVDSNGTQFCYDTGVYTFFPSFSACQDGATSSFNAFRYRMNDLSQPFLDTGLARMLIAQSEKQIHPHAFQGKFTGHVLLAPSCLSAFLSPLLERCAGDHGMLSQTSPWRNKLGQRVADPGFSLAVVPLDPRIAGGERLTTDGYISENYVLIQDGILQSFALSRQGARATGHAPAPNTSRNLLLKKGAYSFDELVQGIDHGMLVTRFSGTGPNANGEFSGVAKNGFRIEGGKITDAVSECMISGNFLDMLERGGRVGNEYVCDGSDILPWVAFDGVTLSGK